MAEKHIYNHVNWYMNDVTAAVVAESGIPSDRYHIGKLALKSFKDDPGFVAQIDGSTGESETCGSLLKRSIQCAISLRQIGIKHGDIIIILGPNHLDLAVPWYAALFLGATIAPIDMTLKFAELEHVFNTYEPALIFCQSEKVPEIQEALRALSSNAKLFTFDQSGGPCLSYLLKAGEEEIDNFKVADYDPVESIALILPTSGSTGLSKGAAFTHKTFTITGPHIWARFTKFPTPSRSWLILSPIQWLTAALHYMTAPYIKYTRIQTLKPTTPEHVRYLIETYRPTASAIGIPLVRYLLSDTGKGPCDLTCFDMVLMAGSAVDKECLAHFKAASPKTAVVNCFGMTELGTIAFQGECPLGACGKPAGLYQYRLVNVETLNDIEEPFINGELWMKGPMFKEYINNPKATAEAFAEGGWFRTGDLFYMDAEWNFYFVERYKLLIKYKSYQIAPTEIEDLIRKHPSVLDAAVTGISDTECGELPVSFVILKPGGQVSAQEIKDMVKGKPTASAIGIPLVRYLLSDTGKGPCDLTCFDMVLMAGSAVDKECLAHFKAASPKTAVVNCFGMTELGTIAFQGECPLGACGKPAGLYQYRLVNVETLNDIEEPFINGELWMKGPMFKEYINNPKATAEAFAEGGWFRTGDLFYMDAEWNFYFVERYKLLIKYKSYQIAPTEIEDLIRKHPSVLDAAVTGISDTECGELPVSFVILKPGGQVSAQEIKDMVKEKLSDAKQLRGGVAFVSSFPLTSTSKINRIKLREMAEETKLE